MSQNNIFRHTLGIRILLATILLPTGFQAMLAVETPDETHITVVERLSEESNGNLEFDFTDKIIERLETTPTAPVKKKSGNGSVSLRPGVNKRQGYRVQVFNDGRNQGSLQARAKARGNAIASKFPKYRGQIYTFSSSPNWFTRVGNFATQSEANAAMAELKRAFPAFAGEMRVVKCPVVIIR